MILLLSVATISHWINKLQPFPVLGSAAVMVASQATSELCKMVQNISCDLIILKLVIEVTDWSHLSVPQSMVSVVLCKGMCVKAMSKSIGM